MPLETTEFFKSTFFRRPNQYNAMATPFTKKSK